MSKKLKPFNFELIEELLKTKSIRQIANGLEISEHTLSWRLKLEGVDVRQIKHDYALSTLKELSGKYKFTEMAAMTGFSRRKIQNYAEKYGIQSLIGYK